MFNFQKLSSIMKVELLNDKSKEEIADIWRQYHAKKNAVCAVIPGEMWGSMLERFTEHSTVILFW